MHVLIGPLGHLNRAEEKGKNLKEHTRATPMLYQSNWLEGSWSGAGSVDRLEWCSSKIGSPRPDLRLSGPRRAL